MPEEASPEEQLASKQFTAKVLVSNIVVGEIGPATLYVPAENLFPDRPDTRALLTIGKLGNNYSVTCTMASDEEVEETSASGWSVLLSPAGEIIEASTIATVSEEGEAKASPTDSDDEKRRLLVKDDGTEGDLITALRSARDIMQAEKAMRPSKPRGYNG